MLKYLLINEKLIFVQLLYGFIIVFLAYIFKYNPGTDRLIWLFYVMNKSCPTFAFMEIIEKVNEPIQQYGSQIHKVIMNENNDAQGSEGGNQNSNNIQAQGLDKQLHPPQQSLDMILTKEQQSKQNQYWILLLKYLENHSTEVKDDLDKEDRSKIQQINFAWMKLGPQLAYYLGQVLLPQLTKLSLVDNFIGPEGAAHLSKTKWPKLELIDLKNNNLQSEGLKSLSQISWPKLQYLILSQNSISCIGIQQIRTSNWRNIKQLNLSGNKVGVRGISALTKIQLVHMNALDLANCGLGQQAIRRVIRANWPELIVINMSMNFICDGGLRILAKSNWPKLQYIQLQFNSIRAGMRLMRGRWPEMKFPFLFGNKANIHTIQNTISHLVYKK